MADWLSGLGGAFSNLGASLEDQRKQKRLDAEFGLRKQQAEQEMALKKLQEQEAGLRLAQVPIDQAEARVKQRIAIEGSAAFDDPTFVDDYVAITKMTKPQAPTDLIPSKRTGPANAGMGVLNSSLQGQGVTPVVAPFEEYGEKGFTQETGTSAKTGMKIPLSLQAAEEKQKMELEQNRMFQELYKGGGGDLFNPGNRNNPAARFVIDKLGGSSGFATSTLGAPSRPIEDIREEARARREEIQPFIEETQRLTASLRPQQVFMVQGTGPDGQNIVRPMSREQLLDMASRGEGITARMPVEQQNKAANLKRFKGTLALMQDYAKEIASDEGLMAKLKGGQLRAEAWANYNNSVKAYENMVESMGGMLAKGALGESGVLTDQDIQRAKALFWRTGDAKSYLEHVNKMLNVIIDQQEQALLAPYVGDPILPGPGTVQPSPAPTVNAPAQNAPAPPAPPQRTYVPGVGFK